MAFEKRDKVIVAVGITLTITFFLVTVFFRSGAF